MKASFIHSSDAELFATPGLWDLRAYSVTPITFQFTLASLELAPGIRISRTVIDGHLRARGVFCGEGVHLEFVEMRSQRAYLQSLSEVQSAAVITSAGSSRDTLSSEWAESFSIHLDAARTAAILDADLRAKLDALIAGPSGRRALVAGVTRAGHQLRRRIREMLAHVEVEAGAVAPPGAAHVFDLCADARQLFSGYGEALLEMTRTVIEQACSGAFAPVARPASVRVEIAREIEALLWEPPALDRDEDVSLDEIAQRLRISRRTIQIALQEFFGLGYVAYRRLVRLHQLRDAIARRGGKTSLARLGYDFHFSHFGRLAADYKALFGRLPSDDLRNRSRSAAVTP